MERKKILLVNAVNAGGRIQVPVGLIYLASNLKRHGYECEVFHVVDSRTLDACREKIRCHDYLFVGFSIWMGPSALDLLSLAALAKSRGIPTLAGGKFISSLKTETMNEASIDIAGIGYCEDTIIEVADALRGNRPLGDVKGIIYRAEDGEVITTPRRTDANIHLDRFDYDLSFVKDWNLYLQRDHSGLVLLDPLETQRGCLFQCSFCFHSKDDIYRDERGKKQVCSHSVDYVIEKAKYLKKVTGVNKITFCDDEFWINGKRSLEIMEKLKQIGIELLYMRIRFSSINKEMLRELKRLNVNSVACGLESGSRRIFELMNKGQTLETVEKKLKILQEEGMKVNTSIILGNPTETKAELLESVRYTLGLRKINKSLNIVAFVYAAIPSTVFGDLAVREGFKKPDSIRGWVTASAENHDLLKQWLPWYTEDEKKAMIRRDDYFSSNSTAAELLYGYRKKPLYIKLLTLPLYLYERISFYRLYYWFFSFPIEAKLFMKLFKIHQHFRERQKK
ncbi:MAG: radical SAM protein [Candidatus Omnitrophota bacterium]